MDKMFFWGGSSSAFQYEGGADKDGKGKSFYDNISDYKRAEWMGNNTYADYSSTSNFYEKYVEDIGLMKEMGYTAFRMSISWTRIYPNGDGDLNMKGIDFYKSVFEELKKAGIEPIVTLYHWDMPQSLIERYNGWYGYETVVAFKKYVDTCFEYFGKYVNYWLTLNESNLTLELPNFGTGLRIEKDDEKYNKFRYRVYHNTNIAHFYAVNRCHKKLKNAKIGCMIASSLSYPLTSDPSDVLLSNQHNQNLMYDYLDLVTKGKYTNKNIRNFKEMDINIHEEDKQLFSSKDSKIDFISFSYYFSVCVGTEQNQKNENAETLQMVYEGLKNPRLKESTFGWTIDPIGLRVLLNELYDRYELPLILVENGLGVTDDVLTKDKRVHDDYRIEYLTQHISSLLDAVKIDGVDVFGFLPWGTIDLYSASGNPDKRYGFVYVDYEDDFKRYKKDSFFWYKKVIETNGEILRNE